MRSLLINLGRFMPDSLYLRILYYKNMREFLNLKNPVAFNEKLQWLKINNRKPEYSRLVDKYEVRNYVKEKIGEKYLVPLLGVWDTASDIDFNNLPSKFVLKCNHDSRSVVICKDKSKLNIQDTVKKLNKHLKRNLFWYGREWPYKNVKPCVIAEEYLEEHNNQSLIDPLIDYKVLCFNGKAKVVQVHCGRGTDNYTQDHYDLVWNYMKIDQGIKLTDTPMNKPPFLEDMIYLSEILVKDIIHVRVDWYFVKGQLFFGEITFFAGSGFFRFINKDDDVLLGNMINLKNDC